MAAPPTDQSPRLPAAISWLRPKYILAAAFFIGPILAALAPLGLAALLGVVVAALALHALLQRRLPPLDTRAALLGAAFLGWAALTIIWTDAMPETARFIPRAVFYIAGGFLLVAAARDLLDTERSFTEMWLFAGIATGAFLFAIEIASETSIALGVHYLVKGEVREYVASALTRSAVFFAIFAFPAGLVAYRRWGFAPALAVLGVIVSLTLFVQGYKAALGAGIGFFIVGLGYVLGQNIVRLVAAAIAVLIVAAPMQSFVLHAVPGPWMTSTSPSVKHRIVIWQFVTKRIAEKPILGWGLNSSRAVPGGKEGPHEGTELLPLHPHNVPLQLWLELGFIGAALAAAGLAAATLRLNLLFRSRLELGLATATVGATVAACAVGYGMWQGWWLGTIWLALAAVASLAPSSAR
jgi:O-antigen ligase